MLFRELSYEAQHAIVDAMLGDVEPLREGSLKEEITQWANDERNFHDEQETEDV
jgi:hypothetical protein